MFMRGVRSASAMKEMRWLSLLALLAYQGCASLTWAEYPLKDSGRVANPASNIYWLDKHRVLFQGHFWNADGSINGPGRLPKNSETLYEWNVEVGTIKEHGDIGGGLCYANGYVRYWRRINGESQGSAAAWIAGELGSQAKIDSQYVTVDRETCKPQSDTALPGWTRGKAIVRLRRDHGFLVLGEEKDDRNTPVTYHPRGEPDGIIMPFKRREFHTVTFFEFKAAYFLRGDYFVVVPGHHFGGYNRSPWPTGTQIPAWWLYPDGRIEAVKLPTEARFATASRTFPTMAGIHYISPDYPSNDGLFKVVDEVKVERVVKGFIEGYAVSSDGCRIAIDHNWNYSGRRGQGTLKVADVCSRGT
jgi:hypothetical protein